MLTMLTYTTDLAMARPPDLRAVLDSYQGQDVAKEFVKRNQELAR